MTARTRARGAPDVRTGIWLVCLGTGFVTLVDQSMVGVAVPALRADLGASTVQVQWILAGYSLAFGLVLVPAGRLGDAIGRRALHLGGLVLFAASALVSATADDAWAVVVARVLQGLGAGVVNPQVHGTLQAVFHGPERARAFAGYGVATACSSACGPLLGGLLTAVGGPDLGWRLVLAASIPLSVLLLPLAVRHLPRVPRRRVAAAELDLPGSALVALATTTLLLPFVTASPAPVLVVVCAATAALLVVVLVRRERRLRRRGGSPLLVPALFTRWDFSLGTGVALCVFGAVLGLGMVHVLLLQSGLGLSAFAAGLVLLPGAVLSGVCAAVSSRFVARSGRRLVVLAAGTATVALLAEALVLRTLGDGPTRTGVAVAVVAVGSAVTGAAVGAVISPNQVLTLAHVPVAEAGVAAGLFQLSQRVSAAIAVPAVTGAYLVATTGVPPGAGTGVHLRAASVVGVVCATLLAVATALAVAAERSGRSAGTPAAGGPSRPEGVRSPWSRLDVVPGVRTRGGP